MRRTGGGAVLWQYEGGVDCGLRAQGVSETVTIDCEDPPVSPLRVQKGGTTYGIGVVDTTDPNALPANRRQAGSRIRIQTSPGVKALRKQ